MNNIPNTPDKEIPNAEFNRINKNAILEAGRRVAGRKPLEWWKLAHQSYIAGAKAEYLRHHSAPYTGTIAPGDKERQTGFAIWAAQNGWTLWPTAQEGQEPTFLRPTNDANLPEEILFASELYDLFLQQSQLK